MVRDGSWSSGLRFRCRVLEPYVTYIFMDIEKENIIRTQKVGFSTLRLLDACSEIPNPSPRSPNPRP